MRGASVHPARDDEPNPIPGERPRRRNKRGRCALTQARGRTRLHGSAPRRGPSPYVFALTAAVPTAAASQSSGGVGAAYSFDQKRAWTIRDASGHGNTGERRTRNVARNAGKFGSRSRSTAGRACDVPDSRRSRSPPAKPSRRGSSPDRWGRRTYRVLKQRSGALAYSLYANSSSSKPLGESMIQPAGDVKAYGVSQLS